MSWFCDPLLHGTGWFRDQRLWQGALTHLTGCEFGVVQKRAGWTLLLLDWGRRPGVRSSVVRFHLWRERLSRRRVMRPRHVVSGRVPLRHSGCMLAPWCRCIRAGRSPLRALWRCSSRGWIDQYGHLDISRGSALQAPALPYNTPRHRVLHITWRVKPNLEMIWLSKTLHHALLSRCIYKPSTA